MQQSETALCVCVTLCVCVLMASDHQKNILSQGEDQRIRPFCVDMLSQLQRVCVWTQAVSLLLFLAEGLSHHSTLRLLPLLLSMFL